MVFALPEIGLIAAALLALLVLFGFEILRRVIASTLARLPVIGGAVSGAVEGWLTDAYNIVLGWLHSAVGAMANFWDAIFSPVAHILEELVHGIESAASFAARVTATYIPEAIASADAYATQLSASLDAQLTGAIDWLATATIAELANVRGDLNAAIDWLATATNTAIASVWAEAQAGLWAVAAADQAAVDQLRSDVAQAIAVAAGNAAAAVSSLEQRAATAYGRVESWTSEQIASVTAYAQAAATAAFNDAVRTIDGSVHDVLAPFWENVITPAEAVAVSLPTAIPDVVGRLETLPQAVPLDLATAIAGLAAITIPLSTYVDQCGVPLCRNLGGFGNDLSNLLSLLGDGLLLAFLADAVAHPEQVAHDTQAVVDPMVTPFVDAVKALVG